MNIDVFQIISNRSTSFRMFQLISLHSPDTHYFRAANVSLILLIASLIFSSLVA